MAIRMCRPGEDAFVAHAIRWQALMHERYASRNVSTTRLSGFMKQWYCLHCHSLSQPQSIVLIVGDIRIRCLFVCCDVSTVDFGGAKKYIVFTLRRYC